MDIQGKQALQKLINEMHDVTGMWSVEQMVTHVWQAAKAHETKKLEGCVVVPVEPTEAMYQAYARHSVAPMSTLSKTGYKAMLEAARGGNE